MNDALAPGLVGIIAQDTARFTSFGVSITGLAVPPGTQIRWQIGHSIAANMNELVRAMLANPDHEWLFVLGDDHAFGPDLLMRLLAWENSAIVAPLCLTRTPPYKPVLFTGWADEEKRLRRRLNPDDYEPGLVQIHSAGSAGMLIRRRVFEAMTDPWFEAGRVSSVEIGEDVYFCDKAREAQFLLYADLRALLGHCTTATVWPARTPEGSTYGFQFNGGLQITMPPDAWEAADRVATGAAS